MIFDKNKKHYTGKNPIINDGSEIAPGIFVYENVINNSQDLIDFALLDPDKWRDSRIVSGAQGNIVDKKIRNTRILDTPATFANDVIWFEVSQVIWSYGNRYGIDNDVAFSNMEHPQLLHYSTEEGFYKSHIDSVPGTQRIFSAVLYLNDVEVGGETYFNKFDLAVPPQAGKLIIFPANYVYVHEAKTPKSNDKFALVTWFNPVM